MKGIISTTFEDLVRERLGEGCVDELFDQRGLKTDNSFVAPVTNRDEDLVALVLTAAEMAGLEVTTTLFGSGRYAFFRLVSCREDPDESADSLESLFAHVDDIIHVEVRKLWPEAETQRIHVQSESEVVLIVRYESRRRLCPVFEGLIAGLRDFYRPAVVCEHIACPEDGGRAL